MTPARDPTPPSADDAERHLLADAARLSAGMPGRLAAAIDDIFLRDDERLDERTRGAIDAAFAAMTDTIAAELREHGARLLKAGGHDALAARLARPDDGVADRLWSAGLPRDPGFIRELIARVRLDLLAAALPTVAPDDPDRPSLLPRLAGHPDRLVAQAAAAVMVARNRRGDPGGGFVPDLPAELHVRLAWWVAAALRHAADGDADAAPLDAALQAAVRRNLAAQDEGERLEATAQRLAAVLDPHPDEVEALLVEAIVDRQPAVFAAILAHALGAAFEMVRELVLEARGERLWLACRAVDLPRAAIARIELSLAEAQPRRDIDRFADLIDHVAAISPERARAAIAPLALPPDYRDALARLGRMR